MSWFINNDPFFKNIAILSAKGNNFGSLLMGISKNEALKAHSKVWDNFW